MKANKARTCPYLPATDTDCVFWQLCEMYDKDCIFDKFACCLSGDGLHYATGSYRSIFFTQNISCILSLWGTLLAINLWFAPKNAFFSDANVCNFKLAIR